MANRSTRVSMEGRDRLTRLADFLFEVGMLRRTPRSGYQFLGSGSENVATHSFGTSVIGYALAGMAGADAAKTVLLCLFHDIHEARTGDFNYVNKLYNTHDSRGALRDGLAGTGLSRPVLELHDELEQAQTLEAQLAQDADQLDLMVNLKEELDLGNRYARKWLECSMERLRTPQGRELAEAIMNTDHTDWWFLGPEAGWWRGKNGQD
jgi:putative hydrolases of HD superfamily